MSILSRVKENQVTLEASIKDSSGASFINDSGLYDMVIEKAFVMESEKGSIGIYVGYKGEAQLEDTIWLTNQQGETFYNKGGKDFPLLGYVDAKRINYLLTGEMIDSITKLSTEQRLIKHFKYAENPEDKEGKKVKVETTEEKEVLTEWIGKSISLLIQMEQKEGWDKDTKSNSGKGAETKEGEPITEPKIIGYFNEEGKSASEALGDKEPVALAKGLERIAKTPIKMFKAKGATKPNTSKSNASSGAKAMPPKPSIF